MRSLPLLFVCCLVPLSTASGQGKPPAVQHPFSTTALAPGLTYSDPLTVRAPADFLRGHPTFDAKGDVHAVVEIPAGACDKWEVQPDGVMRWDMKDDQPRTVKYLGYPCNYGIVPRALLGKELGGDGDPLDMLVLGPAVPRGTVMPVVVLGTIKLVDAGDKDDKLIAVPVGSPMATCASVEDLDKAFPGVTAILRLWFENYKGAGALQCSGFGSPVEAKALLTAAIESFTQAEAAKQPTPPDSGKTGDPRRGR